MKLFLAAMAALSYLISTSAFAIVNLEELHLGKPKEGLSANTSLGISGAAGNSEYFDVEWTGRLQLAQQSYTRYALLQYAYGESFQRENQNSAFLHLRNIQHLTAARSWETFVQAEQDKFARLQFRGLLGGGMRWEFNVSEKADQIYFGTGGFYSYESIEREASASDSGEEQLFRGNFYLVYKRNISDNALIHSTTYYQPSLSEFSDYRLLEVAGLSVKINELLSLSLNIELTHDSAPPELVEKTDINYKSGLIYQLY